jgi:hypothetical protein
MIDPRNEIVLQAWRDGKFGYEPCAREHEPGRVCILPEGHVELAGVDEEVDLDLEDKDPPPKTKYKFTAVIYGNSHQELMEEVLAITRGEYLIMSDYEQRDSFDSYSGRNHLTLEHTNPDQTPEKYPQELDAWWQRRKAARKEEKSS